MKIKSTNQNDVLTIAVEGRIDSTNASKLEKVINKEIRGCEVLVFDFEKLEYISSAGLRILLGAKKFMGNKSMKVININSVVNEVFEITGFSYLLDTESN